MTFSPNRIYRSYKFQQSLLSSSGICSMRFIKIQGFIRTFNQENSSLFKSRQLLGAHCCCRTLAVAVVVVVVAVCFALRTLSVQHNLSHILNSLGWQLHGNCNSCAQFAIEVNGISCVNFPFEWDAQQQRVRRRQAAISPIGPTHYISTAPAPPPRPPPPSPWPSYLIKIAIGSFSQVDLY